MISERQAKNIRLDYFNLLPGEFADAISELERECDYSLHIPNIGIIAKNKLFELEDFFYEKKVSFYSKNPIELLFFEYISIKISNSLSVLKKISNEFKEAKYLLRQDYKIFYPIISRFFFKDLKKYKCICDEISNFSLDKNLITILTNCTKDSKYQIFTSDNFKEVVEKIKTILEKVEKQELSVQVGNLNISINEQKGNNRELNESISSFGYGTYDSLSKIEDNDEENINVQTESIHRTK